MSALFVLQGWQETIALFRGDSTGSNVQSATGIEGNASFPITARSVVCVQSSPVRGYLVLRIILSFLPKKVSPHLGLTLYPGAEIRPAQDMEIDA